MKLTRRSKTLLQQNQVLTKASVASMVETALSPSKPLNDLTGNTVVIQLFFWLHITGKTQVRSWSKRLKIRKGKY